MTSDEWHTEGKARFRIGEAFFKQRSQVGRDLAVLSAIAYKAKNHRLRILDAMTGCGVRALRYALEAEADYVWANEGNPDLCDLLSKNLSVLAAERYQITHQDALVSCFESHCKQDFYDLIDIDCFGAPIPYLSAALWAVKLGGLLYLASTDGRATSGRDAEKSVRTYGAYARSHSAPHEQGLRLLLGKVAQEAAARGLCASPLFSYYHGEVNRVMVRIERSRANGGWSLAAYGFIAYCHHCGHFQTVAWKQLGHVDCPCGSEHSPAVSGPLWLGPLHNTAFLAKMHQVAKTCSSVSHQCLSLIEVMQAEAELPPYSYSLAEIGRRSRIDIPPRDALIDRLQSAGFLAARSHINDQAIKTTAPMAICLDLAQEIVSEVSQLRSLPE